MKQKKVFFKAGVLLLSLLLLPGMVGCGAISSLVATPIPTATSTPIPTPTPTPIDPMSPFHIGEAWLQISKVTLEETSLVIQVKVISGIDNETVASMEVWITDGSGERYQKAWAASGGFATNHEPFWVFSVPTGTRTLILHFPSGETVDLTPWLK